MRSRLAQQRQQYMARLLEEYNHGLLHRAKHGNTFSTQFFLLEWCHEYLLFFFDVGFDLQQV